MSMIDLLRSHESNADQILITVQAGADPKKLSIRVGKSERLGWITNAVKLNMKTFEHVFPTQIYFCDSVNGEVLGVETPLAPYHGKVLIARVKAGLCEGKLNGSYPVRI